MSPVQHFASKYLCIFSLHTDSHCWLCSPLCPEMPPPWHSGWIKQAVYPPYFCIIVWSISLNSNILFMTCSFPRLVFHWNHTTYKKISNRKVQMNTFLTPSISITTKSLPLIISKFITSILLLMLLNLLLWQLTVSTQMSSLHLDLARCNLNSGKSLSHSQTRTIKG